MVDSAEMDERSADRRSADSRAREADGAACDVSRGIVWSYRDAVRGKNWLSLIICMAIIAVAFVVIGLVSLGLDQNEAQASGVEVATSIVDDLFTIKAQDFGQALGIVFVVGMPALVILFPIVSFILKIAYTVRDRSVLRTPENLAAHEREASFAWMWPLSIIAGAVDFTAAFAIYDIACTLLEPKGIVPPAFLTTLVVVVCLVWAERCIRRLSRGMAAYLPGNHTLIQEVACGQRDAELPEGMRNPLGRAKVARALSLGVVNTLPWAVRLVKGIALRTRVKLFSGFLNSAIHGILTAFSFGIASTVANEVGAVNAAFAEGREEEYLASLSARADKRPSFKVEAVCLIVCIAYTVASTMITIAA